MLLVSLLATSIVVMLPAIPRSTASDQVCCNASCSWHSLVVLLATTCVAMPPAIPLRTLSDLFCCNVHALGTPS